jgi:iron complex outermembrane receptor protein
MHATKRIALSNPLHLNAVAQAVCQALAVLAFSSASVAQTVAAVDLAPVVVTGKTPETPEATETAPSQGSLTARSAQSTVSDAAVRNFTSPVADYTQVLSMTPGVFSYSPNGVGLGDSKITLRGLSDSFAVFSFDGIPFNDTNGVSHHSWVFFPAQFLGGAVVDRSPGAASTIGQAAFAGSVDLRSRTLEPARRTSVTASIGTWNTRLIGLEHETGQFGQDGSSNLLVNVQQMKSDGYETFNKQDRQALSVKYQTALGVDTVLTLFGSYLDLKNNTPNIKGVTRASHDAGDDRSILSDDPTKPNYYGYNFYDVYTNFSYAGITSNLGDGWKLDDKAYFYQYHNQQNYNGSTITTSSAIDKLNSYGTAGNVLRLSRESQLGTLRTGLWLDQANSKRYQIPSDPRTGVDQAAPNFNEHYITTTLQPYVEYEFKIGEDLKVTPGVKYASYRQSFDHQQDNGGAVGTLGGTYNKTTGTITGGAPSLSNAITYHDVLPAIDVHYKLRPNWSTYVQYAVGDEIPSTSVFDVKNAQVSPAPKATKAKTLQLGTVWNSEWMTLSADVYRTKFDGAYTALAPDATGNVAYVLSGTQVSQGIEFEGNVALGAGFSLYGNGTLGSLKYDNGQWVAGAPRDTETLGVNYQRGGWAVSVSANRVGRNFNDAKDGTHEAFVIDPIVLTNFFANYTIKNPTSFSKQLKLQLAVNNLTNRHDIVSVTSPATGSSSAAPSPADLLTVLPARSVALTATLDF